MIVTYCNRPALAAHTTPSTTTFLTMLDAPAETYSTVAMDHPLLNTEQPRPLTTLTDLATEITITVIELPDFVLDDPDVTPAAFRVWCNAHGITYYARPRDSFNRAAALAETIADEHTRVIMEDLS